MRIELFHQEFTVLHLQSGGPFSLLDISKEYKIGIGLVVTQKISNVIRTWISSVNLSRAYRSWSKNWNYRDDMILFHTKSGFGSLGKKINIAGMITDHYDHTNENEWCACRLDIPLWPQTHHFQCYSFSGIQLELDNDCNNIQKN